MNDSTKERRSIALVIPTIREESFRRFVREWDTVGLWQKVDLLVMEDNPIKSFDSCGFATEHWAWNDIETELGDNSWIIPRRSDCVRSFGYYMAYKLGYEYIMTLDDDCYPEDGFEDLVGGHLKALTDRSKWFNTLSDVKPRGIPFYNTGKRDVKVNHGLWTNVLDYDAPTQLVAPTPEQFAYDNRIVPQGSYFPFCGMNWMASREAFVLMYHLLMGQIVEWNSDNLKTVWKSIDGVVQPSLIRLPLDRFGDIHCGIIMKKICDVLGWNVSSGTPYIHHDRASNVFTNLKKEANGLEINETFWEHIDNCLQGAVTLDACWLYNKLGEEIIAKFPGFYPEYSEYYSKLGKAMQIWAQLF